MPFECQSESRTAYQYVTKSCHDLYSVVSVTRNCFFRDRGRVSSFFEVLYMDGLLKLGFRAWDLPPREDVGSGSAPPARPYIPFEGRTTTQDSYVPKVLSDDGPTFGSRSVGSGAPGQRPYVPFEGQSETQASFPYVGRCVALLLVALC